MVSYPVHAPPPTLYCNTPPSLRSSRAPPSILCDPGEADVAPAKGALTQKAAVKNTAARIIAANLFSFVIAVTSRYAHGKGLLGILHKFILHKSAQEGNRRRPREIRSCDWKTRGGARGNFTAARGKNKRKNPRLIKIIIRRGQVLRYTHFAEISRVFFASFKCEYSERAAAFRSRRACCRWR